MRRVVSTRLVAAVALVAASGPARADEVRGSEYALELDLNAAYDHTLANPRGAHDLHRSNGGDGVGLTVLFRTPYFVAPWIDVSYVPLASSQEWAYLGPSSASVAGGGAVATSSVQGIGMTLGPALDLWRFRAKAGIGAYDIGVRSSVLGTSVSAYELDLGYVFTLSGWLVTVRTGSRTFKLGLEGRLGLITEAGLNYVSLGITITEDAIAW